MSWSEHTEYAELYRELNAPITSYAALAQVASRGLPDACGIRPLTWMLLLHTAPLDRSKREGRRAEHRSSYWRFVDMFISDPVHHEKANILQRIKNDVKRTMRINHLFASDPSYSAALIRILFVFANLWPQIGYVQGLNEIVVCHNFGIFYCNRFLFVTVSIFCCVNVVQGPMYYVFRNDQFKDTNDPSELIEADTFFCFMNLVSKLNFYIEDMDSAQGGIMSIMHEMYERLGQLDPALHRHLTNLGIEPAFYSLRWITTIFTREFSLPDSCRLWDSLFAIPQAEIVDFIQAFCCAMLIAISQDLLKLQHDAALQMLQDYPPVGMEQLLHLCYSIRSGLFSPNTASGQQPTILSKIWMPNRSESSRHLFSRSLSRLHPLNRKDERSTQRHSRRIQGPSSSKVCAAPNLIR